MNFKTQHGLRNRAARSSLARELAAETLERRDLLTAALVADINALGVDANIVEIVDVDGTAYFGATDVLHGWELWKSDGTAEGTVLVKDIYPGSDSSAPR